MNNAQINWDEVYKIVRESISCKITNNFYFDDIVQDTVRTIFENINKYEERGKFHSWVRTIANNEFYDFYKKQSFNNERFIVGDIAEDIAFEVSKKCEFDVYYIVDNLYVAIRRLRAGQQRLVKAILEKKSINYLSRTYNICRKTLEKHLKNVYSDLASILKHIFHDNLYK